MKKLLFVLLACCILFTPVLAADDELTTLSDQQLLAVYDKLMEEIQKRSLDTSALTQRDSAIVFGENIHVVSGSPVVCLPNTTTQSTDMMIQPQTQAVPTATPVVQSGDNFSYESQNIDNAHVQPGQVFDITWYLLNTGTTTWTTDYVVRFWSGDNFLKPGKTRYYLNAPVPPNTVGAVSVDAVAPTKPGTYYMVVVLGNENEENFGWKLDVTITVD